MIILFNLCAYIFYYITELMQRYQIINYICAETDCKEYNISQREPFVAHGLLVKHRWYSLLQSSK